MSVCEQRSDDCEKLCFQRCIMNFQNYLRKMKEKVTNMEKTFDQLSEKHQKLLPNRKKILEEISCLSYHNQQVINQIIDYAERSEIGYPIQTDSAVIRKNTSHFDRVKTTLKQVSRDWSLYGEEERSKSYGPILDILNCEFPSEEINRSEIKVLSPGSGMGRLPWEIFSHGFDSEGCEFSWYMVLFSQFILDCCAEPEMELRLYPFIHETCNLRSWDVALQEIKFPDVCLSNTPEPGGRMQMGVGDFLDLYSEQKWNCVATVFFIDTAHNIIEYVERIYKILNPGGLWINNGPLLYHFANSTEKSIELTWEELKHVILEKGFKIEIEDREKCSYVQNKDSFLKYEYNCILFTARKPA